MSGPLARILRGAGVKGLERAGDALSLDQWMNYFSFNGISYPYGSGGTLNQKSDEVDKSFAGYATGLYRSNGIVFACIGARHRLFTEARFQFRQLRNGRPGDMFGTPALAPLETPWPNGTTGDLLGRALQDVDICGNFFALRPGRVANPRTGVILDPGEERLTRLRPDWVTVVAGSQTGDPELAEVIGYAYTPGGQNGGKDPIFYPREQVAHWTPTPDPMCNWLGISWLTPVLTEIMADGAAMTHKLKFFEHGATPNLMVTLDPAIKREQFNAWTSQFKQQSEGVWNAYKTLYLGGGADAKVIGANMQQMDFKTVQGHGEPLALDTPVPTPTGWTTMGELKPGDRVIGRDGKPANVLGVSPVHHDRECYRLTMKDGTSIVADAGHLWCAKDQASNLRAERTYSTTHLLHLHELGRALDTPINRVAIPPSPVIQGEERDLLIDPYVLGAWLGDGQTAGAAICGADDDLAFITAEIERRGYTTTQWKTAPDKVSVIGLPGGLRAALDAVGVLNNKHIPAEYMRASAEQRWDLLRGLMDTDGSVGTAGGTTCEFSTKYAALANQTAELIRSLGVRCRIGRKVDERSRTGEHWRVIFCGTKENPPFLLPRKVARCTGGHVVNRSIVSIERVESVPVRCIKVDTPDHLFLAGEGMWLTHNTRIASAAGVPPIIVGLSEGLEAATYSNYGQARRAFADGTMRPLWRGFCAAMGTVIDAPQDKGASELWYDDRDIAFLQEDQKDAADIQQVRAMTIHSLVSAGFTPESVVASIEASDFSMLEHTGMYSVQLMPAGTVTQGKGSVVQGVPSKAGANKPATTPAADSTNGADNSIDTGRLLAALRAAGEYPPRPTQEAPKP